ncbi:MAG: hypothetical protein ACKOAV_08430, partial [Bacteroidota bacterium]
PCSGQTSNTAGCLAVLSGFLQRLHLGGTANSVSLAGRLTAPSGLGHYPTLGSDRVSLGGSSN